MNSSKHILFSLISARRGGTRWRCRLAVCVLSVIAAAASLTYFQPGQAQAQQTSATLHGAAALERLKQDGQYDSLQAAVEQARYGVKRADATPLGRAAWHAPNQAAGYDAYITETGVSIAVSETSYVGLSLRSIGYGQALQVIAPGAVSGDQQTINIARQGVREWFINSADGLEHGFTLDAPPGKRNSGTPLRLALQVSEGWRAVAGEGGKYVTLRGANDEAVEYGKLVVRDARGLNIPARLAVVAEEVVIEVEDAAAQYPLTIDPLFTLQKQLLAADAAEGDVLGHAVALDGDTAVIGAPYDDVNHADQGSAYVFVRSGATWTQQARLVADDGANLDLLGWTVALDGDTAVIGAYNGPGLAGADQGAAYVFVRTGQTWAQQKRLNASDGVMAGLFGTAVAISGDTVLVGAPNFRTNANFMPGAVYVFVRSGANWTQQTRLTASDIGNNDWFGSAVAIEDDTALIGALGDSVSVSNQGSAHIFKRSGTTWTAQLPILTAGNPAPGDSFGHAVALDGDKIIVGAPGYGSDERGAVFTFRREQAGWAAVGPTFAPNPMPSAAFGIAVALSGDRALVGASLGLFGLGVDQRSAYAFVFDNQWLFVRQFGPELGSASDRFGYAVALSGDTALVGAHRADAAANDQGAAYVFTLRDSQHSERQKLFAPDGEMRDLFGSALALDGDTLAIAAVADTINDHIFQGSVYIFVRNGQAWTFQQKIIAPDGAARDQFGEDIALDGDTLAVGAPRHDINGDADRGAAYIFTRNGTTWSFQQKLRAIEIDALPFDLFGAAIALRGHTVLVGAPQRNSGTGQAYVFTRNGTTWTEQKKLLAGDAAAGDEFGASVAYDGDTAVIGATGDSNGAQVDQGSAYVFIGSGATWTFQQKLTASDGATGDYFGAAVAIKGDTLAVGAPLVNIGTQPDQGAVYVFTRSGTAWTQAPRVLAYDGDRQDGFGYGVALSESLLAVGAQNHNESRGTAYLYTRLGGNWHFQQQLIGSDTVGGDAFGSAVAVSGDTVVVGAASDDFIDGNGKGSAYVFGSPACPTITLAPTTAADGVAGAPYGQRLIVSGGAGEYRFAVTRGALPPGINVLDDFGLWGMPTTPGTYRFTITTTYYLSLCTSSREYTITVSPACPSSLTTTPASLSFAAQGGTGEFAIQTGAGCAWHATTSSDWLTFTSSQSGTGPGLIRFTVAPNAELTRRNTTIFINGGGVVVVQGGRFLDVPDDHPFAVFIGKLAARGVTLGCNTGYYCPDGQVTRDQMAAFIIRALGEFNPPAPTQQRFSDVPLSNPFAAFIERLAAREITLGCGNGIYCPSAPVTREQMAAFIIRALHSPGYVPPPPAAQRFQDVPLTSPFAGFIEELAQRQITLGCGNRIYCPNDVVTRAQMAAFLVRAFKL